MVELSMVLNIQCSDACVIGELSVVPKQHFCIFAKLTMVLNSNANRSHFLSRELSMVHPIWLTLNPDISCLAQQAQSLGKKD